jgi:hypothetical protein
MKAGLADLRALRHATGTGALQDHAFLHYLRTGRKAKEIPAAKRKRPWSRIRPAKSWCPSISPWTS